jgi:hypothetical protein
MASEPVTGVVSPLGSAAGLQAVKSPDRTMVKLMSKYFISEKSELLIEFIDNTNKKYELKFFDCGM